MRAAWNVAAQNDTGEIVRDLSATVPRPPVGEGARWWHAGQTELCAITTKLLGAHALHKETKQAGGTTIVSECCSTCGREILRRTYSGTALLSTTVPDIGI